MTAYVLKLSGFLMMCVYVYRFVAAHLCFV